ncbi:MAG TPA: hypothetical protein VJ746_14765 [Nitrospira sp.]|nr:hypothetical protein [Nitrospira sp.]
MLTGYAPGSKGRHSKVHGTGGVMLDPLAQVGIRVLMAVRIGCSQLMMDILRDGEWRDRKQQENQRDGRPAHRPPIG